MLSVDRQRGTFLGLAIGDAFGAAVEFEMPGEFPPVTGYRGGGPHGLAPGEWTDDTSMALALADSIASVGSGYVVKSLEAALWAFHDATDFREAVLRAVNLGDDADTTGAVCGQLAGAYWGESGIPAEWRDGLARPEMIEKALRGLVGHSEK